MDSHNPTVRAFVAIEVPGTVCRIMDSARECLSALADDLRWTAPENIHLTLKFLGDIQEKGIPQILSSVNCVARETHAFRLSTEGVGGGPSVEKARVVWLGVGGETRALTDLHLRLETVLEDFGVPVDKRKYYPHITLARARRKPVRLPPEASALANPVHFMVERLVVFKSELHPEGALHTPLGYSVLSDRVDVVAG